MIETGSHYTVLARRFRPQSFEEIVGQEHVGQALRNAILGGRVAHAYLFTGARGVGKTSTARIFAKALNCPNVKDGVPCNECDVCHGIGAGNDVDVLEIDGASNRRIDDIRQIRANVGVRSMRSPYKVYIIDEVHMLTTEAFNALLKTLEEPPPNVKFVFCTTEPNKVPETILSRCQRFDFGTIAEASIANRLKQIAECEQKEVTDEAINLIARRAAGSMRDAQSMFDQLLAFGSDRITAQDVHSLLGTASDERLMALVDALIQFHSATALDWVESATREGVQIGSFSDQLLAYLRDLLVTSVGAGDVPLSSVAEAGRVQLSRQSQAWGTQRISAAMQILVETKGKMQRVNYARALLELALVRMATLEGLDQISGLIDATLYAAPSQAGVTPRPGSPPLLKKKPEPVAPAASSPSTPKQDEPRSGLPESIGTVPFSEPTLPEFWGELLQRVPEIVSKNLRNHHHLAISGPNRLEIFFTRSYLFSKSYCERAEALKQLESLASQLAGCPINCCFSIDESTAVTRRPALPGAERKKPSSVEDDPFVQQAVSIFGGQVVEVRPLAGDETMTRDERELQ